ncbi:MAG: 1,4-alpha-glucan branching protein GlgB [Ectothiorhodospiraceae bacterium]|nr:1,4-alpha-glucan branching protein GlgB [Chromatiales bacterium]MCP5156437.1 1,4-alpha-glucan branching protein GlgB [Ectothiorhodospiraceae bacterium]
MIDAAAAGALDRGEHGDPFAVLGPHREATGWVVRCLQHGADRVELIDAAGSPQAVAEPFPGSALFEARVAQAPATYRWRVRAGGVAREEQDPYRFPSPLGELDLHLIGEGNHLRLWEALGARPCTVEGVDGVHFAVWAPNARRVSVIGPFNGWDGRRHPMRRHPANGVWDLFLPGLGPGTPYKLELLGSDGQLLPHKADPLARRMEPAPGNASIVHASDHRWADDAWMSARAEASALDRPIAIYEVHAGSWRHYPDRRPQWRDLARDLVPYVRDLGYTHIELLPITEHPFDGSWGYQPLGMYAPTWRHGAPDDFKAFVDCAHRAGLGVIVDWVPAHFPRDEHGLARFDGTCLYEHADPRQGEHRDWGTLIYNFGRPEVANFLIASALWWIEEYHVDALRVDAVASMLYLDYSREDGDWVANVHGGNENLEAIAFMRRLNDAVHARGGVTMAEESTAWPMVSRPTWLGGLGYDFKWNMGWMHDTLAYMREDPVHRRWHHDRLTFGLLYAFSESFVLPLSHDEVVHGKGPLIDRMPGDRWQRLANLRLYYAFHYGFPGKKLLFMGGEFAQTREWHHDRALDWHLLDDPGHRGVQALVRDLNHLHAAERALHQGDCEAGGFEWVDCADRDQSVIAFLRRAHDRDDHVLVVCNFTPVPRHGYRLGVPALTRYRELLNSDAACYGGSGIGNLGESAAEPVPAHGHTASLRLTLPPLAALILAPSTRPDDREPPSATGGNGEPGR